MPKIQIIGPDEQQDALVSGYGTRILVDGREVPDVRDIKVHANLDAALTVTVEAFVTGQFSFDGAADVHVNAVVTPGFTLVESTDQDGTKRYRAEPDPDTVSGEPLA